MSARNSPFYAVGLTDGAADAARSPRVRHGYDPARAHSWMYRRGFAHAFLAARRLVYDAQVKAHTRHVDSIRRVKQQGDDSE